MNILNYGRIPQESGWDRGAGARENRGREGYGREAGEKGETPFFKVQQCVIILSKTRT